MIELKNKKDCCGCGSCVQICPAGCIRFMTDEEGFSYPETDADRCIGCGACERACPVLKERCQDAADDGSVYPEPKAFGGQAKDEIIRYYSSSGGIFSVLAEKILEQGGVVYGASVDPDIRVKHIGVETKEDLALLRGSKYVQSSTENSYSEIRNHLKNGRKVLFAGTPCQTAGLYHFLGRNRQDNLITVDFICHGVPSPGVFADYVAWLESRYSAKITGFRFRLKDKGWNQSGLQLGTEITFENGEVIRHYPAFNDYFMNGFLDDVCLRPSCHDCAFKSVPKQYADITIADFWGLNKVCPALNDNGGTSLILVNTAKGGRMLQSVSSGLLLRRVDYAAAAGRNTPLTKSAPLNDRREKFFHDYKKMPFERVMKKYMNPFAWGFHKVNGAAWKRLKK